MKSHMPYQKSSSCIHYKRSVAATGPVIGRGDDRLVYSLYNIHVGLLLVKTAMKTLTCISSIIANWPENVI